MDALKAHPFALEYPRASDADAAAIEADMRSGGYDERFPIVLSRGMILDGLTRHGCAARAGVNPTFTVFEGTEEQERAFVIRANEHRRHLDPKWLSEKRAERLERVAIGMAEGKPIAQLAKEENVTRQTIQRDVDRLGKEEGCTPHVHGKTTETQPTSQQTPQVLVCRACRMRSGGPKPGCKDCVATRTNAAKPAQSTADVKKPVTNGKKSPKSRPGVARGKSTADVESSTVAEVVSPPMPPAPGEKCPTCGHKAPESASRAFKRPTVEEVRAYCLERKNTVDPEAFIDHYESNGWKVGKAAMKDWRAAVRTWEKQRLNEGHGNGKTNGRAKNDGRTSQEFTGTATPV